MVTTSDRHMGGCIYCGSCGPFSDEHVVPAGLGGDDKTWLLEGCVCKVCNTDIFSKLETKFLRSSPVALARLFLQQKARDRGSRTAAPSIQPKVTVYRDQNSGLLLAAEMGPKGKTMILPQVVVVLKEGAAETAITGSNHNDVREFLARLQNALADEVILIEKRREGFEVGYQTTALTWTDEAYMAGEAKSSSFPPNEGLWLESLTRPETASIGECLPFAVFALPKGQLVCRGESPALASALLILPSFVKIRRSIGRIKLMQLQRRMTHLVFTSGSISTWPLTIGSLPKLGSISWQNPSAWSSCAM